MHLRSLISLPHRSQVALGNACRADESRWSRKISAILVLIATLLLTLPVQALADRRPDFDEDAKPILRTQPDLLHFVREHFEVQETGYAKVPGDDERPPAPPYIFRARHRGVGGPYNITLLIQPGPAGHVLFVKEDAHGPAGQPQPPAPSMGQPPPSSFSNDQPTPANRAPAPSTPPPSSSMEMPPAPAANGPTSDTPSGPIKLNSNTNGPSLAPPPDPSPAR